MIEAQILEHASNSLYNHMIFLGYLKKPTINHAHIVNKSHELVHY